MSKDKSRPLRILFNADTAATMQWNFRPQQREVRVYPGETALAFYTAKNPTDEPIDGISTYNVVPFAAGPYFNKIQCFCFEEQRLNPHEEVDMPVFFYIDPDIVDDPNLEHVDTITLSYTFFQPPAIEMDDFKDYISMNTDISVDGSWEEIASYWENDSRERAAEMLGLDSDASWSEITRVQHRDWYGISLLDRG